MYAAYDPATNVDTTTVAENIFPNLRITNHSLNFERL